MGTGSKDRVSRINSHSFLRSSATAGLNREVIALNTHSIMYYTAIDFNVASFAPREVRSYEERDEELGTHSSARTNTISTPLCSNSSISSQWLAKIVWKFLDERTLIVGSEDVEDDRFPPGAGKGYVRAMSGAFRKYERLPDVRGIPQTKVTYVQQVDLKGFIPKFLVNGKSVGEELREVESTGTGSKERVSRQELGD